MSTPGKMMSSCYYLFIVQGDGRNYKGWGKGLNKPHNRKLFQQKLRDYCQAHLIRRNEGESLMDIAARMPQKVIIQSESEARSNATAAADLGKLSEWLPRGIGDNPAALFEEFTTYPGMQYAVQECQSAEHFRKGWHNGESDGKRRKSVLEIKDPQREEGDP